MADMRTHALITPELKAELRAIVVDRVGEDALTEFEVTPYVDHNGEDSLKVLIGFSSDRFDGVDRLGLISDLFDHLNDQRLDLFPYTTFVREGEAA